MPLLTRQLHSGPLIHPKSAARGDTGSGGSTKMFYDWQGTSMEFISGTLKRLCGHRSTLPLVVAEFMPGEASGLEACVAHSSRVKDAIDAVRHSTSEGCGGEVVLLGWGAGQAELEGWSAELEVKKRRNEHKVTRQPVLSVAETLKLKLAKLENTLRRKTDASAESQLEGGGRGGDGGGTSKAVAALQDKIRSLKEELGAHQQ